MIEVGKEYRNEINHRMYVMYEKDDRFAVVNLFTDNLSWHKADGKSENNSVCDIVMPLKLEMFHTYIDGEDSKFEVRYCDNRGNYWAANIDEPCTGRWYYADGSYYKNEKTSQDLIKEIHYV
jgi:hypothetical protein